MMMMRYYRELVTEELMNESKKEIRRVNAQRRVQLPAFVDCGIDDVVNGRSEQLQDQTD